LDKKFCLQKSKEKLFLLIPFDHPVVHGKAFKTISEEGSHGVLGFDPQLSGKVSTLARRIFLVFLKISQTHVDTKKSSS